MYCSSALSAVRIFAPSAELRCGADVIVMAECLVRVRSFVFARSAEMFSRFLALMLLLWLSAFILSRAPSVDWAPKLVFHVCECMRVVRV